jgi:ABC-type nitrate/sulfonate/bicarbonate transport system substrate-binding protein
MTLNRRRFMQSAVAGAAGMALSGPLVGRAAAATPITMQAAWINDAEFIGYYVAADDGLYTAAGLDFKYLSGGPDVIPESSLLAGRADVALTAIETTIPAITDQGAKFKIIGAQYQKNPIGVVSLAKSNIKEPKDLIGKTLACPPVNLTSVKAMLKLAGVPEDKVRVVPYEYDPTPLIEGNIDASIDFTTNVPFAIEKKGLKASSFLLYDFGFTVYADTVVVTEETLAKKRGDLVKWLRASRAGWDKAFVDPAAYPAKFAETWFKGTGRSIDNEVFFTAAEKPIMTHPKGIFTMTEEDIAKNIAALAQVGIKATRAMFDTTLLAEI